MANRLGLLPSASPAAPSRSAGPGEHPPAGQVKAVDLGLDEADPLGQHVLQPPVGMRTAPAAGATGDPGQLGEHLVVVVPVRRAPTTGLLRSIAVRRKATCNPA